MASGQILLVEDNPDDEELTLRALKKNGITNDLITARDGPAALEFLLDPAQEMPAVVLLDLNLPKLSGFEVLEKLRSNPRTALLPIVILTSSRQEQDVVEGYRLGANAYVRKPVSFEEFTKAVATLGLFWLLMNEPLPAGKWTEE